ncbi:hypothetical protein JYB64_17030 [Algoriphagus aestuarii]|nr:hypothetical protein [Algoriphagus aestuarii]
MPQKLVAKGFKLNLYALLRFSLLTISSLGSVLESSAQYVRSINATKTYTTHGTFTITDLADITGFDPSNEIFAVANVDILLVGGGGGGGGGTSAGGGGGGEVKVINLDLNLGAQLIITIGNGGNGSSNSSNRGTTGGNTIVVLNSGSTTNTYRANGGGYGGGSGANRDGGTGGSGGGGGARKTPSAQAGPGSGGGTSSGAGGGSTYLNSGGNGSFTTSVLAAGAGGGGASGAGTSGISLPGIGQGGNGGNGIMPSGFTGNYGAGGGGTGTTANGIGGNGYGSNGSGGNAGATRGNDGFNGVVVVNINYRILPVEFLYFNTTYNPKEQKSLVEWATSKESENSHFEVERAINSVKEWETIATIDAKGYSEETTEYHYIDNELTFVNGNVFYRIKQVDFDGTFSYSNTKAIQINNLRLDKSAWLAFPNPSSVGTGLSLKLVREDLYQDEPIFFTITNTLGDGISGVASSPKELEEIASEFLNKRSCNFFILEINWGLHSEIIKLIRN